jgi:hypothetical protein
VTWRKAHRTRGRSRSKWKRKRSRVSEEQNREKSRRDALLHDRGVQVVLGNAAEVEQSVEAIKAFTELQLTKTWSFPLERPCCPRRHNLESKPGSNTVGE